MWKCSTALEFPTTDDPNVMRRATHLAIETNHHLIDTLYQYHAVTLENEDALLVTADNRYRLKAERYGMIAALRSQRPLTRRLSTPADWHRNLHTTHEEVEPLLLRQSHSIHVAK